MDIVFGLKNEWRYRVRKRFAMISICMFQAAVERDVNLWILSFSDEFIVQNTCAHSNWEKRKIESSSDALLFHYWFRFLRLNRRAEL